MKVTKRNGQTEEVRFDKVTRRLNALCDDLPNVQTSDITHSVVQNMYDEIPTSQVDELSADTAMTFAWKEPENEKLAIRLLCDNIRKMAPKSFWLSSRRLHDTGLMDDALFQWIKENKEELNDIVQSERDTDLTFFGLKTLVKSYLVSVDGSLLETPQYMWLRVSCSVHWPHMEDVKQSYEYMSKGYYTHATPTLFNAGSKRPQCSSCYLMGIHDDSLSDIYKTVGDVAQVSKWAGGVGLHVSHIRAKGSKIRGTNGRSDGIIPMLRVFNNTARYVNQGGKRKGSIAIYLEPWHADVLDFLELRLNEGDPEARCRDLFLALWVPDLFMKRLEQQGEWSLFCPDECPGLNNVWGQEFEDLYERYEREGKARATIPITKLWQAVVKSQVETGTPYVLYKDTCNRQSNQKNLGTLKCSNLCVAGDTPILTSQGYTAIKELEGQEVEVWNGQDFAPTVVQKTGINQPLLKVKTSHGYEVECTPYHKFYIATGKRPSQYPKIKEIRAGDLQPGMRIARFSTPVVNTFTESMENPYTHGLFCADGTLWKREDSKRCAYKRTEGSIFCKRHANWKVHTADDSEQCCADSSTSIPYIDLYGIKKKLIHDIKYRYANTCGEQDRIRLALDLNTPPKYFVPVNFTVDTRLRWLEGYLDGDGCIVRFGNAVNVQYSSIHKDFMMQVALMLQTLGVIVKVAVSRPAHSEDMPGGTYQCHTLWRSNIDSASLVKLKTLGFAPKRLDISGVVSPHHTTNQFIRITEVVDEGKCADTWCFNEPQRHRGMFGGLLLGQCAEIQQFTAPDEVAVCNLASVALPKFVKEGELQLDHLREVARFVTRALDRVIDRNFYPTKEAQRSNQRHRPIGIGVQGLADVFHKLKVAFDSPPARKANRDIFETMYYGALQESAHLARTIGPYETFEGSPAHQGQFQWDMSTQPDPEGLRWDWEALRAEMMGGLRNSLLLAPMPTASTAQILGNNECFEPYTSNVYLRRTMAGEFVVVNKFLVDLLKERRQWNQETRDRLVAHGGSIQDMPDLFTDEERARFKTVWELSMRTVIDMASDRQQFICQSQSMNLFVADPTNAKVSSMLMYGWKKGLKTGMYYLRTRPKARAQQFTLDPTKFGNTNCASCSA